jgi:ribosomal protein S27AE
MDSRSLTVRDATCPSCGASVELFSDEQRRKCPSCGASVSLETMPVCAMWCPSAKSCIGVERYAELKGSGLLDKVESPTEPSD